MAYNSMIHEIVKVVNGKKVYRMKGTHGFYWVDVKTNKNGTGRSANFKTIKSAVEYINKNLM